MKKILPRIAISIFLVGSVIYLAMSTDEYIEINAMTGATRTKMRYAYVSNTTWKVSTSWPAESATRQGISTDDGWHFLSVISKRPLSKTHACGHAPASFLLSLAQPEALNLHTTDEIDSFVRDFVRADESQRRKMIIIP